MKRVGAHGTLVLEDVPEGVWSAFQADRSRVRIPSRAHRDHVERWARSRRVGAPLEPESVDDDLLRGEAFRLRAEHLEVIEALGAAVLARATGHLAEHDFVCLLADVEGVVVRSEGGGRFAPEAKRVRLMEGARWAEPTRGTNAIGTALAERRPTFVLGRAHYARPYHGLACYAAPIFDAHGRVVAVLDATGRSDGAHDEIGQVVLAAAGALGELLRLEAFASAGGSILRVLAHTMERTHDPMVLVEARGRVSKVNASARLAVGAAGRSSRATLGLDWGTLVEHARSGLPLHVERPDGRGGARAFRLFAEPVVGVSAEPLAVLVRLEPATSRAVATTVDPTDAFRRIHARDASVARSIEWARTLAKSELPVMLLAETGSGKELFAEAIHAASPRASGPFVAVNCGALAPTLLESELFGYAPGAFTGADRRGRRGLLREADRGTLFLDEVAEMPLAMQVALLRVLETGTYHRVGESTPERCDVRVICATCRDLDEAMAKGTFRSDLYFRLKGATLRLPPLRERSDLPSLVEHLIERRHAKAGWVAPPPLTDEAMARLRAHPWPGNVRELCTVLDVALVTAAGRTEIDVEHLPAELSAGETPREGGGLERAEAKALQRALARHDGNVSAAARELGVARSTVYRLARRLGVDLE
ncbi:MAG: sigma-54-dependent Fis family transcriptional regulator [Sandaracinus sp.]|nr:sigma-54-dependent Fis family transcriptional regulator [Sandaracinus sp.]MCB9631706.1 sigma-54-dependent Fis family transcriptional regulator [Sandaracinus sp.]